MNKKVIPDRVPKQIRDTLHSKGHVVHKDKKKILKLNPPKIRKEDVR